MNVYIYYDVYIKNSFYSEKYNIIIYIYFPCLQTNI